ncbi:MAG: winged helix-turn-helix transcriptional regulator [Anaerolineae bacterium]
MYVVALVDPRDLSRAELGSMLADCGCEVSSFGDWRMARSLLPGLRTDAVVLTDWRRLGGRGAHRYLRGPARDAPFILITDASNSSPDERFAAVLSYPVAAEMVFAALRSACEAVQPPLQLGAWSLDRKRRSLSRGQRAIDLTPIETELLHVLMAAGGDYVNSSDLVARAWGISTLLDRRVLYTHVAWLRRKLRDGMGVADPILSERRRGYRFDPDST